MGGIISYNSVYNSAIAVSRIDHPRMGDECLENL